MFFLLTTDFSHTHTNTVSTHILIHMPTFTGNEDNEMA